MANKETRTQTEIMLHVGNRADARVFRNHVAGVAYQGKLKRDAIAPGVSIIEDVRVVTCGLAPGSSDIVGWKMIRVEPQHVGRLLAVFTAIEVKEATSLRAEQKRFLALLRDMGGIAGVARSKEDAQRIIESI